MDWIRIEGNWKEFRGQVKEKWGKITDDDLTAINGKRDQLEGRLQQRYGLARDQARNNIDSWFSTLKLVCHLARRASRARRTSSGEHWLSWLR
jgi:uncharacterized protein YjbJ (UPF0337 family)